MAVYSKRHGSTRAPHGAVLIDRTTEWGNPFKMSKEEDRDKVIAQYKAWLWTKMKGDKNFYYKVASLRHKDLVCWCSPLACHGDVLSKAAEYASTHSWEDHT